jgi:hypothetical protein
MMVLQSYSLTTARRPRTGKVSHFSQISKPPRSIYNSLRGRGGKKKEHPMRTLTAYGIGVVIVLAVLNGIAWQIGSPRLHNINMFSAGFVLGMLGTCIAAFVYGYRQAL